MLPRDHAVVAAAIAAPLARLGWRPAALATFVASAVLIDVDHYLGYAIETRNLSFWAAYRYHRGKYRAPKGPFWTWRLRSGWPSLGFTRFRAFHAIPFLALLFALSLKWRALLPVALGFAVHRAQDELWSRIGTLTPRDFESDRG